MSGQNKKVAGRGRSYAGSGKPKQGRKKAGPILGSLKKENGRWRGGQKKVGQSGTGQSH